SRRTPAAASAAGLARATATACPCVICSIRDRCAAGGTMDAVLSGLIVYAFLLIVFRISGKRSLGQVTTFDFVLLLIVAETTQQALLGDDYSITNAFLLIVTLLAIDIGLSLIKHRS